MSRLLKGLSSLVNGNASRPSGRDPGASDGGPSTLTTPLFPVDTVDSELPGVPPRHHARGQSAEDGVTATQGALAPLVPLPAQPAPQKGGRKSASSRALNASGRATTQVALATHVEPTPPPKVARTSHRSSVVLTETEKLRLQIMQVQLKLTGLGLYEGAIDGLMNPDLVDGVRHFQTLKGMRDSGMLTTGTLTALGIRPLD